MWGTRHDGETRFIISSDPSGEGFCLFSMTLVHIVEAFSVLCFWQRIRSLFPGHQMVFLDKLCINQMDSEKKQQGILGLGAFVLRSKKLLVLWSPRYFNRMWCHSALVEGDRVTALVGSPPGVQQAILESLPGYL